mgnify:FL=1
MGAQRREPLVMIVDDPVRDPWPSALEMEAAVARIRASFARCAESFNRFGTITGKWQLEQPDLRFPLLREIDVVSLTAPPVPLGSTRSEGTRTRLDLAGRWSP